MPSYKHDGCSTGARLNWSLDSGRAFTAINRTRSYDCPGCLVERNAEHLEFINRYRQVEVGWSNSDELTNSRRSATRRRIAFGSITYEHTKDILVVAQVSSVTVGRTRRIPAAFREVIQHGLELRQKAWSGNKYTRLPKPKVEHGAYTFPDWATKQDRTYVLKALGFQLAPEGMQSPEDIPTEALREILTEAFKAYNSGDMDYFVESLKDRGRRAGSWGWE